jgi:hypothetical protein
LLRFKLVKLSYKLLSTLSSFAVKTLLASFPGLHFLRLLAFKRSFFGWALFRQVVYRQHLCTLASN